MASINFADIYKALGATARAQHEPLNAAILVDVTAPHALMETVKLLFTPVDPGQVTLLVDIYDEEPAHVVTDSMTISTTDLVVLVAGTSSKTGALRDRISLLGTPCVVVGEDAATITGIAEANETPISSGDLIVFDEHAHALEADGLDLEEGTNFPDTEFSKDLGGWICDRCKEKRLAFAHAFPFMRRPLALSSIRATSAENAAIGVVAFIPGADMPVMTVNQAKMILQIAAAYGQTIDLSRAKELAGVVASGFLFRAIARQLVGLVPVGGWAVKGGIGYTGTLAMGHAALEYFAGGGNVTSLVSKAQGAVEKVSGKVPWIRIPGRGKAADDEIIPVDAVVIEPMTETGGASGAD